MYKMLLALLLCSCGSTWIPCEKETPPGPVYAPKIPEVLVRVVPDMAAPPDMSESPKDMSKSEDCKEDYKDMAKPPACECDDDWCDDNEDNDNCECDHDWHGKGRGHCFGKLKWLNFVKHGSSCKYVCQ